MNIQEAINILKRKYKDLESELGYGYGKDEVKAIWFYVSDKADSYEVNEEHVGMKEDGTFVWAYASGCSCWSGDYNTKQCDYKSLKVMEFEHEETPKEWEDALIKLAEKNK